MTQKETGAERPPLYLAYLLRLWQIDGDRPRWRASLRSVANGEQRGFSSLEALFEYLREETADHRRRTTDDGRRAKGDGRRMRGDGRRAQDDRR